MVGKIFDALLGVKKTSTITKATSVEAIDKIVNDVNAGNINPVEAYVILDYLKKVCDEAITTIRPNTLDQIQNEGDNSAFGVKLTLRESVRPNYKDDKEWSNINEKFEFYKDQKQKRENYILKEVKDSLETGTEPRVNYQKTIAIYPQQQ